MVCTCCDNGTFVQTRDPNYSATLCVTCRHDQISHNGVERNIPYYRPREPVSHGSGASGAGNLPRGGVNQHYDAQLFPRDQVHAQDPPPPTSAMGNLPPEQYHHQSSAEHSQKGRPLSNQDPIGDQPSYSGDDSQRRSRFIPSPRDVVEGMFRNPNANLSSQLRRENAKRLVQDPRMTTEERYKMIELDLLITANREKHGDRCYSVLSDGMDVLERYSFNLLRPDRPDGWRSIRCSNNIYKSRIQPMVGANDLLSTLGYTTGTAQEICFPPDAFPDQDLIVEMAADLLLGRAEVDLRMANEWMAEDQTKSGNVGFAEGSSAQIPNSMFDSSRFEQQAYIGSTMRPSAPRAGGDTHMPTQPPPNAEAQVPPVHRPAEKDPRRYSDLDHSSHELTQGNHAPARFSGEHRHAHMQGHDRAAPGRGNSDFQQGPPGRSEFSGPQHQPPRGQGNRSREQLPADGVAYGAMHPGRRVSDQHRPMTDALLKNPSKEVHEATRPPIGSESSSPRANPPGPMPGMPGVASTGMPAFPPSSGTRVQLPKIETHNREAAGFSNNGEVQLITPDVIGVVPGGGSFTATSAPKVVPVGQLQADVSGPSSSSAGHSSGTPSAGTSNVFMHQFNNAGAQVLPSGDARGEHATPRSKGNERQLPSQQFQSSPQDYGRNSRPHSGLSTSGEHQPHPPRTPGNRLSSGQLAKAIPGDYPSGNEGEGPGFQRKMSSSHSGQHRQLSGNHPQPSQQYYSGPQAHHSAQGTPTAGPYQSSNYGFDSRHSNHSGGPQFTREPPGGFPQQSEQGHQHANDNPSRGVHRPSPNPPVPKQAWPAGQRGNPDSAPLPTSHPQACQGSLPSPSTPVLQAYDSVSDAQRGMPRGSSTVAILKDVHHGAAPQGPGTPASAATGASAAYERTGKYTNDPGQYQHPGQATGGYNAPAPVTAAPTKSSHPLSEGSPFTHRPGPGSQPPQGQAPAPKQDDATVGHGRHLEDSPETQQSLPECYLCEEDIHGDYFTCQECDDELFCAACDQKHHKKRRSSHVRRPIKAKGAGGASNHNQKTSTSSSNFPTSYDQRPPPSNALPALTEVASPGSSLSPMMSSRSDGTGASAESSSSSASVPGSFDRLPLMSASTATAGASPPFRSQKASASQEEAMRKNRARLEYEEHMRKKAQTPPGPSVQPHNLPAVVKTSSTPGVDSDSDNDKFVSANSSPQHSGLQASPGTAPTAVSGLQAVPVPAKRSHRQSAANTQPPVPVPRQRQGSQFQRTTPKPDIVLSQQTADVATSSATPPKTPAKSGDLVAQSSNAKHTGPSAEGEDKLPSPEPVSFNPLELEVEKEDGQDYIRWMREVEKVGKFSIEDMASAHNVLLKGSRSSASTLIDHLSPVQWLHGQGFSEHRQVVRRRALELCPKIVQVSENEASEALCEAGMDAAKASMIVIERREKAAISVSDGLGVTKEAAHHVIGQANGDAEGARRSIAHHLFSPVLDRLWGQPDNGYDRICDNDEKELIFPSLMTDVQAAFDQRARSAMAEIKCLNDISKAELAIRIYDRELSRDMSDVVLAASECLDLEGAGRFLKVDCAICMDTVPQHKLGSSCFCQCKVCAECLKVHYTLCIKDFVLPRFVCPSCQEPDILQLAKEQPETLQFYLSNFDIMIRNLLNDEEVHDLFAKKQRDFFLQRSPDFRWCPHCAGGFVNDIPNRLRVDCPYCGKKSCFQCKAKWEEQHEGMSCEVFEKWKADNDPEYQAKGLAAHMAMNGITCPNCDFGYELAIGGCMHFTCNQCKHEFCAGCNNAFMRLGECTWPEHKKMNFHCHCPRDCLSKLRDYPVGRLQMILENSNVGYRKDPTDAQVAQAREDAGGDEEAPIKCSIKLQKEGPDSKLYDEVCGDNTADGHAGLCEKHYKEYLVHEINVHALDPLLYMDKDEMLTVIRQSGMLADTPEQGDQLDEIYKGVLLEFVKARIPLKRVRTARDPPVDEDEQEVEAAVE